MRASAPVAGSAPGEKVSVGRALQELCHETGTPHDQHLRPSPLSEQVHYDALGRESARIGIYCPRDHVILASRGAGAEPEDRGRLHTRYYEARLSHQAGDELRLQALLTGCRILRTREADVESPSHRTP